MTDTDFLKELIARGATAQDGYFEYAHLVACLLPKRLHEQLQQLLNGPTWDGDVISKNDRDELMRLGLAFRVCHKGQQGFSGGSYFAYSVLKRAGEIRTGTVGA